MAGFGPGAFYRIRASRGQLAAGALAALLLLAAARQIRQPTGPRLPAAAFGAGMSALGYAPLVALIGGTMRHYYTFSPYLALVLITVLPRPAVAGLAAWFAMGVVAETEQCWIPMSQHLQAIKAGLRGLPDLQPGDPVVIPGTPVGQGMAPNFALITPPFDRLFGEFVTGVKGLEFWREIVVEKGRPRFYHRHSVRDTTAAELTRAHVLIGPTAGPYFRRPYWVELLGPDDYQVHCLNGSGCLAPQQPVTAEQLQARRHEIYLAKPFEHGNIDHLHY